MDEGEEVEVMNSNMSFEMFGDAGKNNRVTRPR